MIDGVRVLRSMASYQNYCGGALMRYGFTINLQSVVKKDKN